MSLRVVLVGTKHSGNVGSVARAMKNFGLEDLVLVAPRCEVDRQAYALASHASDVLERARVVATTVDALSGCTLVLGTTARPRASASYRVLAPREAVLQLPGDGAAVMFGPEDTGLSNSDLDQCQLAVNIPTAAYASLNLAQAVNVVVYEWFIAKVSGKPTSSTGSRPAPPEETAPAPREEIEPMIRQMMELLLHIGYTDELKAASVEHMFRRLIDRAMPTGREVAALRGLWSQAHWAADQAPEAVPGRRRSR